MKNESNKPSMTARIICAVLIGSLALSAVVLVLSLLL